MSNKENFPNPSGIDSESPSFAGSVSVLNPPNDNRKRPRSAAFQSNSSVNDDLEAKKPKMEPPTNIQQLRTFLEDKEELKEKIDDWHGQFDFYTIDNDINYMAFHCRETIRQLPKDCRNDCKVFVYNSIELLAQFRRFTSPFEGIEKILMVFSNHKIDRITPLGVFFLPGASQIILDDVMKTVDRWLNAERGSATVTVTKCIAKYDYLDSIIKVWPTAKIIGCSDQYQKQVKEFCKKNKGLTDHHKELTRLACSLCYVPQMYISTGMKVIENRSISSEYGANLVLYLRNNWIGLKSIFGEEIIQRSVKVCTQFSKRMIENYFESKQRFSSAKEPVNNIIDFIGFLRTFSKRNIFEMMVDGSVYERRRKRRFQLNTKLQKETETKIVSSFNEFNRSIEALANDEKAIEQAIEQFMLSIY